MNQFLFLLFIFCLKFFFLVAYYLNRFNFLKNVVTEGTLNTKQIKTPLNADDNVARVNHQLLTLKNDTSGINK